MKTPYLILSLLLYYGTSFSNSLNTVLSQDFDSKERILQLNVHPMFDGTPFVIGIVKGNVVVGYEHYVAQKDQHAYDLRRISAYAHGIRREDCFTNRDRHNPTTSQQGSFSTHKAAESMGTTYSG